MVKTLGFLQRIEINPKLIGRKPVIKNIWIPVYIIRHETHLIGEKIHLARKILMSNTSDRSIYDYIITC